MSKNSLYHFIQLKINETIIFVDYRSTNCHLCMGVLYLFVHKNVQHFQHSLSLFFFVLYFKES